VTDAVHAEGGRNRAARSHTGRYGYQPFCVAPSRIKSPISPFHPRTLGARHEPAASREIAPSYAARNSHAKPATTVEVMAARAYFINQFSSRTPTIARMTGAARTRTHAATGQRSSRACAGRGPTSYLFTGFLDADLIPDGSRLAQAVTIAKGRHSGGDGSSTPASLARGAPSRRSHQRAARRLAWGDEKMRAELRARESRFRWSPATGSTRRRSPTRFLAEGCADLVSLARPLLADAEFVPRQRRDAPADINTCIACNQACLDQHLQEPARQLSRQSTRRS